MPKQINESCVCTSSCSRHGDCEACQEHHRIKGTLTKCGKDCSRKEPKKH